MKLVRALATMAALTMVSGAAHAADQVEEQVVTNSGFYASVHFGAVWLSEVSSSIPADGDEGFLDYDQGFRIGGALGYDINEMLAVEAELSHARVDPNFLTLNNLVGSNPCDAPCTAWSNPAGGSASVTSLMGNVIVGTNWNSLHPYVGVGAGFANVHSSTQSENQYNIALSFTDTDQTWAAQAIVGADYALTDKLSIGGRYRAQWIGPFTINDGAVIDVDTTFWQSADVVFKVKFH